VTVQVVFNIMKRIPRGKNRSRCFSLDSGKTNNDTKKDGIQAETKVGNALIIYESFGPREIAGADADSCIVMLQYRLR